MSEFRRQLRAALFGVSGDMAALRKRKADLEREIMRFSDAIAQGGLLDALVQQIAIRESELKAIANKLLPVSSASIEGRTKELRRFVENGISNLRTLLNRDPALAKAELQSHLSEIRMTPDRESKKEWHYVAEGSWNLVGSGPNAPVLGLHSDGCGGQI